VIYTQADVRWLVKRASGRQVQFKLEHGTSIKDVADELNNAAEALVRDLWWETGGEKGNRLSRASR